MTVLVLGGAASGKSMLAESWCQRVGRRRVYLATMEPFGEEAGARVQKHRAMRASKGFVTVERHRDLGRLALPAADVVLLEDIGNLLANELFGPAPPARPAASILDGVDRLAGQVPHLVIVSNLVFSGAERYAGEMAGYLEALGAVNTALAQMAGTVVEAVAGIPVPLKGTVPEGSAG